MAVQQPTEESTIFSITVETIDGQLDEVEFDHELDFWKQFTDQKDNQRMLIFKDRENVVHIYFFATLAHIETDPVTPVPDDDDDEKPGFSWGGGE